MKKSIFLLLGAILSPNLYAANAWTVSIPYSYWDPEKPWNQQFQYRAILYLTEESFNSDIPLNRTCSTSRPCYIQINTQQKDNPNRTFYPDPNIPRVTLTTETTVGQALKAYFEKGTNYSYTYTVESSSAPDRTGQGVEWCGSMGISNSSGGSDYVVMSGGECANLAPPGLSCSLETPEVDFDYGQLNVSEVVGQQIRLESTFDIYCNQDANVLLSITSPDKDVHGNSGGIVGTRIRLKDDGSLVSYLAVDGQDISSPTAMPVKSGGTTFGISSTLTSTSSTVVPGPFLSYAQITISFE